MTQQNSWRRSLRLAGYSYAQAGVYFVTICTVGRECLFGDIVDGKMSENERGNIVHCCWQSIPLHNRHVDVDKFVVMPNHIHGLIVLLPKGGHAGIRRAAPEPATNSAPGCLGVVIRSFKSASTRLVNIKKGTRAKPLWQNNYYEHIVRDEYELGRIREYIINNPLQWAMDRENPEHQTQDAPPVSPTWLLN